MRKRFICLCVILILSFTLTACSSVSKDEFDSLHIQKQNLEQQIEILNNEKQELQQQIVVINEEKEKLLEKIDNLENGAENQIIQIRTFFENEKFKETIDAANKLHKEFNGTPQDLEGQELSNKSQEILIQREVEKKAEEERIAAEATKSAQEKAREIIRISKIFKSSPDSVGGVELYINFTNKSDKTIKYLTFEATFYNAVGDPVTSGTGINRVNRCRATGPFAPGKGMSGTGEYWGKYYSWDIESVKLVGLEIEYMDGTKITLTKEQLDYVQY